MKKELSNFSDSNLAELVVFAEWTTEFINKLPDGSFAFIESGGKKDDDGKTVPRSLRHLPYKDASGKVDVSHVRNALARVNQVKLKDGSKISESKIDDIKKKLSTVLEGSKQTDEKSEDESKPEQKSESSTESMSGKENNDANNKLVKLNDELIEALKEANVCAETQEKVIVKYKDEITGLNDTINSYKKTEKDIKVANFQKKVENTLQTYCSFFGIQKTDEINTLRDEMSGWSEGMLEKTLNVVNQKKIETRQKPKAVTEPSSNLDKPELNTGFKEIEGEQFTGLSSKEKTEHLFKKAVFYNG